MTVLKTPYLKFRLLLWDLRLEDDLAVYDLTVVVVVVIVVEGFEIIRSVVVARRARSRSAKSDQIFLLPDLVDFATKIL